MASINFICHNPEIKCSVVAKQELSAHAMLDKSKAHFERDQITIVLECSISK